MNLNKKLADMEFCALDLETTGTNPALHSIVEIGIIRFNLRGEISRYETLVNPGVVIPQNVINIHGITDEMVALSPAVEEVLADVEDFMRGALLVIQNPEFDLSFLNRAYSGSEIRTPEMSAVDTVRLARYTYPDLPNHKLNTLCDYLDVDLKHHRALSDAFGCMGVFRNVIDVLDRDLSWNMSDLISIHGDLGRPRLIMNSRSRIKSFMGIKVGRMARIRYRDSEGNVTERNILPRELICYGKKNYIIAHCYLRDNERHFVTDRILEVM